MPQMKEIRDLDVERQKIQDRIQERSRKHHLGVKLAPDEIRQAMVDAVRYIEIENKQWALLGLRDSGKHQQPPF